MSQIVRKGEELDQKALGQFLFDRGLIEEENQSLDILQFTNGYSNLTYLIKAGIKKYVLRKPPRGAIKRGHDMGREYKVLSHLSKYYDKAPSTFAYEAQAGVIDSSFYLMEKIEGDVLTYEKAKELNISTENYKQIAETWLDCLVELHTLKYKSIGLEDLGRPEGYVERQVTNWSKQYLKAATMDLGQASFVMDWMLKHQPKKYDHCLIHNDYKYDNVVFKTGDWSSISAILDWEMCTIGDPLMDLGTSLGYWVSADDGPLVTQVLPSATVYDGNPSREEVVQRYADKSGKPINNLIFYYVYGLFKIAVIAQQIFFRYNKGQTTNPKFAKLDQVCKFLMTMAKQAIQKKQIDNLM